MAAEANSSIWKEVEVCKSSGFVWDPGVFERKQPSKVRRVLHKLFAGFAFDARVGLSVAERHVVLHACGDKSANAARKGSDGDASVCEPLGDLLGEHAWPQDRSALHHSSSHSPFEPQRRPPNAWLLRVPLDRSPAVNGEENPKLGPLPPLPSDRRSVK